MISRHFFYCKPIHISYIQHKSHLHKIRVVLQVIPSDIGANLPWNFPLKGSYWRSHKKSDKKDSVPLLHSPRESDSAMIRIQNLHKVFPTTDGYNKVAVDNLNINMQRNEITGLLGKFLKNVFLQPKGT